jgi:hypothetical protein
MKIVNIAPDDVFEFEAIVYVWSDDKKRLTANYKKNYGDVILTLEGVAKSEEMKAVEKITYKNFRRRFPQHRVYLQGYVEVK